MNEEALEYSYNLFKNDGYNGTIDDYKVLISENEDALNHSFSLFQKDGYKDSVEDYKNLISVKKKETTQSESEVPKSDSFTPTKSTSSDSEGVISEEELFGKPNPNLQKFTPKTDLVSKEDEDAVFNYIQNEEDEYVDQSKSLKEVIRYPELSNEKALLEKELESRPIMQDNSDITNRISEIDSIIKAPKKSFRKGLQEKELKIDSKIQELEQKDYQLGANGSFINTSGTYQDLKNQKAIVQQNIANENKLLKKLTTDRTIGEDFRDATINVLTYGLIPEKYIKELTPDNETIKLNEKVEEELLIKLEENPKTKQKLLYGGDDRNLLSLNEKENLIKEAKIKVFKKEKENIKTSLSDLKDKYSKTEDSIERQKIEKEYNDLIEKSYNLSGTYNIDIAKGQIKNIFKKTTEKEEYREKLKDQKTLDVGSTFLNGFGNIIGDYLTSGASLVASLGDATFGDKNYGVFDALGDTAFQLSDLNLLPSSEQESGRLFNNSYEFTPSAYSIGKAFSNTAPFSIALIMDLKGGDAKGVYNKLGKYISPKNLDKANELSKSINMAKRAYQITLTDNLNEAKELGLDGGKAFVYQQAVSTITGAVSLINPDFKFFNTSAGKIALQNFSGSLKSAVNKKSIVKTTQNFIKDIAKEVGEEELEFALTEITSIGLVEGYQSKFKDIQQHKDLIANTIAGTGVFAGVGLRSNYKKTKKEFYKDLTDNFEPVNNQLNELLSIATDEKIISALEESKELLGNVSEAINKSPENVTSNQIDLLIEKKKIINEMKSMDDSFHPKYKEQIEAINEKIRKDSGVEEESFKSTVTPQTKEFTDALGESEDISNVVQGVSKVNIDGADVSFKSDGDKIILESISVPEENRGQGNAKKALEKITQLADEKGVEIELTVKPLDDTTNNEGLVKLYENNGFETTSGDKMVRKPKVEESIKQPIKETANEQTETTAEKTEKPKVETTTPETKVESEKEVGSDVIADKEYNDFVDNGNVSEDRLNNIAEKVKNQENLSDREKAIFNDKTSEINSIIANETQTKGDTSTDKNIQSTTIKDDSKKESKSVQPTTKPKSDKKSTKVKVDDVTYSVSVTEDGLEITSNKKGKITPTEKKKATDAYINSIDYTKGKKVNFEGRESATEEDQSDIISSESENAIEIIEEIKKVEERDAETTKIEEDTIDDAIAGALATHALTQDSKKEVTDLGYSYTNVGNRRNKDRKSIDEIRQIAETNSGQNISFQDVLNFLENNQSIRDYKESKETSNITLNNLKARFKEITGLNPNNANYTKVLNSKNNDSKRVGEKTRTVAKRLLQAENIDQSVLDDFSRMDINYNPQKRDEVIQKGDEIIEKLGIDNAFNLAQAGQIRGGVKTYIEVKYSEEINRQLNEALANNDLDKAERLKSEFEKFWTEFARERTFSGQENQFLAEIYKDSDLRFNVDFIIEKLEKEHGKEFPAFLVARLRKQKEQLIKQQKTLDDLKKKNGSQEEINALKNLKEEHKRSKRRANKETYTQEELDLKIKDYRNALEEEQIGFKIAPKKSKAKKEEIAKQIEAIKNKWKSASKDDTLNVSIPYAKQLLNATPEIIKLAKLYSEMGGLRTSEIIDNIKEVFEEIKRTDIVSVLKKEYAKKGKEKTFEEKRKIYISLLNKKLDFLYEQIENKKRERPSKTNTYKDDAEVQGLLSQIRENEAVLEEIDPKIKPSVRIQNSIDKINESIAEYDRRIKENDFDTKEKKQFADKDLARLIKLREAKVKEFNKAKEKYKNSLIKEEDRLVKQIHNKEQALEKRLENLKTKSEKDKKKSNLWSPRISELQKEIGETKKDRKNIYSSIKRVEMDSENGLVIPTQILYDLIEDGVNNINDLVAKVKEIVQKDYPQVIDDREVRDAITGYGKKINESGNMLRKKLGSLKIDGTQLSKLEDLDMGKLPKKKRKGTEYTELQKKNIREIQRKMREIPLDDSIDKEAYYKSALEGYKTRLEGQIKELQEAIDKNEQIVTKGNKLQLDTKAEQLKEELSTLRKEYNETFKDTPLSNQRRVESVRSRKENQLKKLRERLERLKLDKAEEVKDTKKITSPEIELLNEQINKINEEYSQVLTDIGIAEQKRIERKRKYLKTREEYYRDRLKRKDFAKNRPRPLVSNDTLLEEEVKLIEIKKKYDDALLEYEESLKSDTEKALDKLLDLWNVPKGLKASIDVSAPFRQGAMLGSRNHKQFQRAMSEMHKSFNKKGFKKSMARIETHELYPLMIKAGLELTEADGGVNKAEERFISNMVKTEIKIKGKNVNIAGMGLDFSERTYTAFLNNLRAEVFIKHVELMKEAGITQENDPQAYKDLARLVNFASGRGALGKDETINKRLNAFFFSPRMITAMGGMLKLASGYKTSPYVRKEAQKTLASFVAYQFIMKGMLGLTYAGLQGLFSDEEEEIENALPWEMFDPRSTDFAKLKIGDTRYQTAVGYEILIRTLARMKTGEEIRDDETINAIKMIKGEKRYKGRLKVLNESYKESALDPLLSFFYNKLSPSVRYVASWMVDDNPSDSFKDGGFKEATPLEHIESLTVPLTIGGLWDDSQDTETPAIKVLFNFALNLYGIGSQTYGRK